MTEELATELQGVLTMPMGARIDPLVKLTNRVCDLRDAGTFDSAGIRAELAKAMILLLEDSSGTARERMTVGEALGRVGDPRLSTPDDGAYWAKLEHDGHAFAVGRHMVTCTEFQSFVDGGGYGDDANWSEAGLAWRALGEPTWMDLAVDPKVAHLVIPNQPVVGVTFHEAQAYACAHGSRLQTVSERRWVVRGAEKRPYPWGAPFGQGKANTREEALGKPCAVALYAADCTPEGVADLAGNVAEWLDGGMSDQATLHPGSWVRPSMAAWAKALEMARPGARSADLGFRLARDIGA
jgi:hypothetical protein